MVWIVTIKWFDYIIILLILLNSVVLGMKDYTDVDDKTERNKFVRNLEPLFTYSFLMECFCKVIA